MKTQRKPKGEQERKQPPLAELYRKAIKELNAQRNGR